MRAALSISLPESMRSGVDEQVERSGFGTASEFIRALIRDAQARELANKSMPSFPPQCRVKREN